MKRNKARILYASFDPVPSAKGASVRIQQFYAALHKKYPGSHLVTIKGNFYQKKQDAENHHVFPLSHANFLQNADSFGKKISFMIEKENWDVVHVRSIWEGMPAAFLKNERKFKLVYEANGFPSIELKYHFPNLAQNKKLLNTLADEEKFCMETADAVITQSETTKEYIVSRSIPKEKITVIQNGTLVQTRQPEKKPFTPFHVLYMGTFSPWQGIKTLLDAVALLKNEPVMLTLLGGGRKDLEKYWRKRARNLGILDRVTFYEGIPYGKLPALVQSHHCGVAPLEAVDRNLEQGCCPIKIFDYMAEGLPVVASCIPAVEEILQDGKNALLHAPGQPQECAARLKTLLQNKHLYEKLSAAAHKTAKKFTWQKNTQKLLVCYERLLDTRR